MVGGFSESPYMYEKIRMFVARCNGLQAVKPAYPYVSCSLPHYQLTERLVRWSAVVRGAAAKGLEGAKKSAIKIRKCRRYYGTDFSPPFEAGKHKEADSYVDAYDGLKYARNQMAWLLTLGQDLSTSKKVHAKASFYISLWPGQKREYTMSLLASNGPKAAQRSVDKVSRKLKHATHFRKLLISFQAVYKVTELTVDLSVVPKKEFMAKRSPSGEPYHTLSFQVAISAQSSLEYSLLVNGKTYGTVTAKYD
jgi:hypothetical protein